MEINRNNYEEYFILYMDNELTAEERAGVEAFAEANPDLKSELALLLQTKLPAENIAIPNKEDLFRYSTESGITLHNYEHYFILYLDQELDKTKRKEVESFLNTNPSLLKEFESLKKSKLTPETISFPDKQSLYKQVEEPRRVITMRWWRIAAAAVLILGFFGVGLSYLNNNDSNDNNNGTPFARIEKGSTTQPANNPQSIADAEKSADLEKIAESPEINSSSTETVVTAKTESNYIKRNETASARTQPKDDVQPKTNNLPTPTEENPYVNNPASLSTQTGSMAEVTLDLPNKKTLTKMPEITADPVVTPTTLQPLYTSNASDLNEEGARQKNKGGGFRGFVRKITRTFEKNTNIEATDGDDRLLVAGLAIKL